MLNKIKKRVATVPDISTKSALYFVVLIGIVSLFADMTYEGARSIAGPYLAILGANALVVSFVAGFGELIGYSLRFVSGFVADKTGKYWPITIIGYVLNLLAVPLLAIAGYWQVAAMLLVIERMGKAIRTPARDAMLSHAAEKMGLGWGFGLHEALDQTGALLGPLLMAGVLYYNGNYRYAFALLLIPTLLAFSVLALARKRYPNPQELAIKTPTLKPEGFNTVFWLYLVGAALVAVGYADFPLIAFHFEKQKILANSALIPIAYAFAMGVSGLFAPWLGHIYDRKGFIVLLFITIMSAFFSPLVFLGGANLAFAGIALWSIGIAAQETLMRAIIGNMIATRKRASAYGIFNLGFGVFWFLGSIVLGYLYDKSLLWLCVFSVVVQLCAVPLFLLVLKRWSQVFNK
jgi:MFS family permease